MDHVPPPTSPEVHLGKALQKVAGPTLATPGSDSAAPRCSRQYAFRISGFDKWQSGIGALSGFMLVPLQLHREGGLDFRAAHFLQPFAALPPPQEKEEWQLREAGAAAGPPSGMSGGGMPAVTGTRALWCPAAWPGSTVPWPWGRADS